jgi:hypothetical protein
LINICCPLRVFKVSRRRIRKLTSRMLNEDR